MDSIIVTLHVQASHIAGTGAHCGESGVGYINNLVINLSSGLHCQSNLIQDTLLCTTADGQERCSPNYSRYRMKCMARVSRRETIQDGHLLWNATKHSLTLMGRGTLSWGMCPQMVFTSANIAVHHVKPVLGSHPWIDLLTLGG